MSVKRLENIMSIIDNMSIYQEDYKIIRTLMDTIEPRLFLRIVEEVINGNLYWSDFVNILEGTEYGSIIDSQLKNQEKIHETARKLSDLRRRFNIETEMSIENNNLVLSDSIDRANELYTEEEKRVRDNILYELTKISDKDNILVKTYKTKLFNAIKNGELLIKNMSSINDDSRYEYDENTITLTERINGVDVKYTYDYIQPEDIFLFMTNFLLPLNYENQVLDEFDRSFMLENNMSESQMKQFKSLSLIMKRDVILNTPTNEEEESND